MKELPYDIRIRLFEREKRELMNRGISAKEYEIRIRQLAAKYRI